MRTSKLFIYLAACAMAAAFAWAQKGNSEDNPLQLGKRPAAPLFQGEQGVSKPEIHFDAASGVVTVKMQVADQNGYFIPNIRRDNFAVYENNVRQENVSVEIEHAPVSLAVLMEWGGRYLALNKTLAAENPSAADQLFDEIGPRDKIALWTYGDRVEQLADFSKGHEALSSLLLSLKPPEFSEINFYDALAATLQQMRFVAGRKAVILISSGVDTFSKTKFDDVLRAAQASATPVYVIDLGPMLRQTIERSSFGEPYARLDWNRASAELRQIAKASGGRTYSHKSTFDLSGVYDDIMENLRVRYVVTYKAAPAGADAGTSRRVRIDLIDPKTSKPLEIVDADGKPVHFKWSVEENYRPNAASARLLEKLAHLD